MSGVPVIKFLFKSEWKVLTDSLNIAPVYESEDLESANDLTTYLSGSSAGLVVTSLRDKNDLIQLASFIKLVKKVAPTAIYKVFVVNFSGDKQFEQSCSKLGILDLIDPKIQTKALRFKIDFVMKSLNAQIKKNADNSTKGSNSVKSLDTNKAQEKKSTDNLPVWADPLACQDDVWILKTESDCKKILTRWLVKFMGPSPYIAQWMDSGTSGVWKFDFKNDTENFISGKGTWFYRGDQKPEFIWSENLWLFTGSAFELYYQEGSTVCSRVKLKDKTLVIAKNSDHAGKKEKKIIESFDKELVFKKEQLAAGESETIEKDAEKYKNLEGKGKTDNLEQGPLSGKGKTSHLNSEPLSLDLRPGENVSATDPLSQKVDPKKTSSYWKGKNEYEQEGASGPKDGPASEGNRSGKELGLDSKSAVQKYYKNHNEAEKFEGKDLDLSGKSSTDEIEGHLSSPNAKKQKEETGPKQSDVFGKSETDKLAGHLSSPHGQNDKESKNKKESSDKDTSAKDLSGKTATDKLAGHLSSPQASEAKEKKIDDDKADSEKIARPIAWPKIKDHQGGLDEEESEPSDREEVESVVPLKKSAFSGGRAKSYDDSFDDLNEESQEELDEFKNALEKPKKGSGRQSEGGTDHLSSVYSSRKKNNADSDESNEEVEDARASVGSGKVGTKEGKVLPFKEKPLTAEPELKEVGSEDLLQAVKPAKVTSYLIKDSKKIKCNLDDYFEQTIIFSTQESGPNPTGSVMLNLNFNYMEKDTSLKFSADVTQVEADGHGSQFITVQISQENASAFNSFMKLYQTRQECISLFLKTAKGH